MTETKLVIPECPIDDDGVLGADVSFIDRLVSDYSAKQPDAPDPARFLFGFAPRRAFDAVLLGDDDAPSDRALVGLMHRSGFFGGTWLRAEILRAQPESFLAAASQPASPSRVQPIALRAAAGLDAANGQESEVLGYLDARLPELVTGFGYNQGYLLQIVEAPPEGFAATPGLVVARGPLWCDY